MVYSVQSGAQGSRRFHRFACRAASGVDFSAGASSCIELLSLSNSSLTALLHAALTACNNSLRTPQTRRSSTPNCSKLQCEVAEKKRGRDANAASARRQCSEHQGSSAWNSD